MTQEEIKLALKIVTIAFSLLAGVLWLFASLQNVRPTDKSKFANPDILFNLPNFNGEMSDVLATAARQSYWNGWASLCASLAALFGAPLYFL
ncbi:hypothetical protein QA645_19500 [Bradyrhizobium sp. CIAT3101]|uniref:hypothetical protein n=1 Tax=Bradyrhizobium sp. CIAT3101 TaxID=439387 RepID=UPI0024B12422|nr:hypothetical protein [Bradyrhizobium sp. CIAT3101]WFU84842.1 hypothetical protein QA645_19500 [Bradyrhizobium sp. CIAT3101]